LKQGVGVRLVAVAGGIYHGFTQQTTSDEISRATTIDVHCSWRPKPKLH